VEGEVEKDNAVAEQMARIRSELADAVRGMQEIAAGAAQSNAAAQQALKG
jgi:hypothetical protein